MLLNNYLLLSRYPTKNHNLLEELLFHSSYQLSARPYIEHTILFDEIFCKVHKISVIALVKLVVPFVVNFTDV